MHSQGRTQLLLGVLSTVNTYMASKYQVIKQGFPNKAKQQHIHGLRNKWQASTPPQGPQATRTTEKIIKRKVQWRVLSMVAALPHAMQHVAS